MFVCFFTDCESFDFYYELPNSLSVIADTNSSKYIQKLFSNRSLSRIKKRIYKPKHLPLIYL